VRRQSRKHGCPQRPRTLTESLTSLLQEDSLSFLNKWPKCAKPHQRRKCMFIKSRGRFTAHPLPLISYLLFMLCTFDVVRADEIAVWNFNDSDLVVDHGSGTLTSSIIASNILFAAGTTNNARMGDVAGQALSLQGGTGTANNGSNVTLNVSTVGFSNIIFSFATQGTGTGFTSNQFQYSVDGTNFTDFWSTLRSSCCIWCYTLGIYTHQYCWSEQQSKRGLSNCIQRCDIVHRDKSNR
jgi:hypothetical protein